MATASADASHIALDRYLRTATPKIEPGLVATLEQVGFAAKRIANQLAVAALRGALGSSGTINVQGEEVEKLDAWSNNVFIDAFAGGRAPVSTLISEELENPRYLKAQPGGDSYALLFDPLDGSSNTDVNGALGTIFAVRRRKPGHGEDIADVLGPGSEQIAAGYALYGPATMLVWTTGSGVNAFVLDTEIGDFALWRENIRMPGRGKTYAVNQANLAKWSPGVRALLERLAGPKDKGGGYSLRYCGAFVGDFHRCLLKGGIFLYPGEVTADGKSKGKLRLMYEVAPMSMIAEQAGGAASTGRGRVLDFVPSSIHERVPVYIGSAEEVALADQLKTEGG